ncbi:MAG: RNA-binding transcriptional accessory protein [Bacteroidales bacterium]|nr:RNA-binding transcriptional accessory protein [Bacteroidales bacterium]
MNKRIAADLNFQVWQVENTLNLLKDSCTIPFISRYRKEATGDLDEVQIADIQDLNQKMLDLEARRAAILKSIDEQGKLSDELKSKIEKATTLTQLEDIYLPYKQTRKTRASIARERGLEPLSKQLMQQNYIDINVVAEKFLSDDVPEINDALQGARDIIAEWISTNEYTRNSIRRKFDYEAAISSKLVKGKEEDGQKYRDYFDWSEPLRRCPSHRLLAIRRAEDEGILRVNIDIEKEDALDILSQKWVKNETDAAKQIELACKDSYSRLLKPAIENEFAKMTKEKADLEAIQVFSQNLRQLLLSAPVGEKRILAIDPGFRTGCKIVCLDEKGDLKHNATIYPHPPQNDRKGAGAKLREFVEAYKIQAIGIGNGTAGRETRDFLQNVGLPKELKVFMVDESGASIYSASAVARKEFPDFDVTVRGSVSIGRRLMDPLAELVKIDAKSIGVGQYQHDVDQSELKKSLGRVVENAVNFVGVDLNTASGELLSYVSGLGEQLAQNIVEHRKINGLFKNRKQLLKVKRLGPKAYEQAAGFLRIRGGDNPLDMSAVHPENYSVVEKMAKDLDFSISSLMSDAKLTKSIDIKKYISSKIGEITLKDILNELTKPGRDPRQKANDFRFDERIKTINDLEPGMIVMGKVSNITKFGVFVDLGIKHNGLIHISNLLSEFVSNPFDVVELNQEITAKVMEVDMVRNRIQLSSKGYLTKKK